MKPAILILGATGVVGQGLVAAALEADWPVVAVAREAGELARLAAAHPRARLTTLAGSVANEAGSAALAAELRALGRPFAGAVVAVSGKPVRGRVLDQPTETMRCTLDADLLPHVAAARHLLPLLADGQRGGSYVLIGGPAGALPWAGYGHRSIAAAAVRMLACVLHDEARSLGVRVQLLAVDAPVCRPAEAVGCPQWPTATAIGRQAIALIERSDPQANQAVVAFARTASGPPGALPPSRHDRSPTARASGAGAADPEGSMRAARSLLRSLISPNANEASPHDAP